MKKTIPLFIVILISISKLEAQRITITGKILFLYTKDTIDVPFIIPTTLLTGELNYEKLQEKVKYYDSKGKKKIITPDQAKEIRFHYGGEDIRMISCYDTLGLGGTLSSNTNIFLKLKIDGKLKLFTYYKSRQNAMVTGPNGMMMGVGGGSYNVEKYILQKGQEEIMKPRGITFRKDMMKYFNDCPKLSQMIDNREFIIDDLEAIVNYYNSNCVK